MDVSGLTSGIALISAGGDHTCALTTSGGVKCWGWNTYGQLGDGTTTDKWTSVDVSGLTSGVTAISAGLYDTCAVTTGGGAKCWGHNNHVQVDNSTVTDRLTPVDVSGLTSGVATISAGGFHTCALTASAGAKCWGDANQGQIGIGYANYFALSGDVWGLMSGVAAISAGGHDLFGNIIEHTCALTTTGGVKCWGDDSYGQLGDGYVRSVPTPVDVVW